MWDPGGDREEEEEEGPRVEEVENEEGLMMEEEEEGDRAGYGRSEEMLKVERGTDDRDVKNIVDHRLPTKEEVNAHNMFHSPYRNWCPVCVKARGKGTDHKKSLDQPRGLSEYSFDYCFPGN